MDSEHSVTHLLRSLKDGDEAAATAIWERFFGKLTDFARRKLGTLPKRVNDEEDLALSAMNALCTGAREGRFRQLGSRDDLWQMLVMITARKASNLHRKQAIRREAGESAFNLRGDADRQFCELLEGRPSENLVESLSLCCEEMLAVLDDKLRQVALLKLAGHTNQEIADIRERSVKSVERYMQMIRAHWANLV